MENTLAKLKRFNLIMGAFHLIQGIAMLFLATSVIQTIAEFQPTITQLYLRFNPETRSLEAASKELFTLPFGVMVASFLLISALAHGLIVLFSDKYFQDLKQGINRFRWFEYALSSSIMIVLIATLFGIQDIASLILIFFVNASMNLFGLVMEQLNSGREKGQVNWGPFIWGSIAGIAPWIVVFLYFLGAVNSGDAKPPAFVYAIIPTLFGFFNIFAINKYFHFPV